LKDFIIGVTFVDGSGNLVHGGGKVVKNAAGFDFPKLFNGSLGRLGILTELSFKVFPEPQAYVTLQAARISVEEATTLIPALKGFDLEGVELSPDLTLSLRLGYQEPTMAARKTVLESLVGKPLTTILGEQEPAPWQAIKGFAWLTGGSCLFKTATHPSSALKLARDLSGNDWKIHLGNGGKTVYIGCAKQAGVETLDRLLRTQGLTGLQLRGTPGSHALLGKLTGLGFIQRVQGALDPRGVFQPFPSTSLVSP
jgi:glycolate oxidase FAD binding subunit